MILPVKRTMEGKVGKSNTVLSDLPESVLHHISSYLPLEDSVRTSVLSKQWNSARKSYPFLDFVQPNMGTMSLQWPRVFLNFADWSLQYFVQNKLSIERMHLKVYRIDHDSVSLINTWLPLALHHGVSDIHFFAYSVSDIMYPLPESTFALNSSLLRGSLKFFRLEKLTLNIVYLSENIVHDIVRNCPNISHLSLNDILGLENLNISKLDKLLSLSVYARLSHKIKSVYVDALSLKQISLLFSGEKYDLSSCCNLREIELWRSDITNVQFHHHISKFPLLEVLKVSCCHGLQSIKVSLQRLNRLLIYRCDGVKAFEIDAPTLSSLEFTPSYDDQNVLISVSSKVIRCSMYLSYSLRSWSLKLREYLGVPFKGVNFHGTAIYFTFRPYMSRELVRPPVIKVDVIDLTGLRIVGSFHWATLLDTLLLSCRPKIVSMTVDSSDEDNCVNIFRKMVQSECQLCCNLVYCKCWHSHLKLKAAKIKSIYGIELNIKNVDKIDHKQFLRALDTFLLIPVDSEVQFKLNWDPSEFITHPLKSRTRISISSE